MPEYLVFNIESASPTMVKAMDRHERYRSPDGTSDIDPARTSQNEVLYATGFSSDELSEMPQPPGPTAALDRFYAQGVKRPAKQAEKPYLRIVIGASGGYFRPDDPDAVGTWDEDRLRKWKERAMQALRNEYGDDLIYASLHLDEHTPHIHALVAPTYQKKPRVPGRRKKNETEDEFETRKEAAKASSGVRTVGRSSHETISVRGSFTHMRRRFAAAFSDLGIEYGEDRGPAAPDGLSTREWLAQSVASAKRDMSQAETYRALAEAERQELNERESDIARRESDLKVREKALSERETLLSKVYEKVSSLIGKMAKRLGVAEDLQEIADAIKSADLPSPDPSTRLFAFLDRAHEERQSRLDQGSDDTLDM